MAAFVFRLLCVTGLFMIHTTRAIQTQFATVRRESSTMAFLVTGRKLRPQFCIVESYTKSYLGDQKVILFCDNRIGGMRCRQFCSVYSLHFPCQSCRTNVRELSHKRSIISGLSSVFSPTFTTSHGSVSSSSLLNMKTPNKNKDDPEHTIGEENSNNLQSHEEQHTSLNSPSSSSSRWLAQYWSNILQLQQNEYCCDDNKHKNNSNNNNNNSNSNSNSNNNNNSNNNIKEQVKSVKPTPLPRWFASTTTQQKIIHFNNAGASPSPPSVIQTLMEYMSMEHILGGYKAAFHVEEELKHGVYNNIGRLLNAQRDGQDEIALLESATVAWTRIFYSMVETIERQGGRLDDVKTDNEGRQRRRNSQDDVDERVILVSEAEYAANVVAACKFAREQNERYRKKTWRVLPIPSSTYRTHNGEIRSTGMIDLNVLDDILEGRHMYSDGSMEKVESSEKSSSGDHAAGRKMYKQSGGAMKVLDPKSLAMICVTHVPTNSGVVNPVNEIGKRIAMYNGELDRKGNFQTRGKTVLSPTSPSGAVAAGDPSTRANAPRKKTQLPQILYLVDACQSAGQLSLNVQEMHCHALTATGRKYLRGPRGTGFLYVRHDVANALTPSHVDHACAPITSVSSLTSLNVATTATAKTNNGYNDGQSIEDTLQFSYKEGARRFEFWESNLGNKLGLGEAVRHALDVVGLNHIEERCVMLGWELRRRLRDMDGISVYHDNVEVTVGDKDPCSRSLENVRQDMSHLGMRCGIVTFSVEGLDAATVKERMWTATKEDEENGNVERMSFELSVVPLTSTPLDSARTGVSDLVRASLTYFNTVEEIDAFCNKLRHAMNT